MTLVLILGGARSGKSARAVDLAQQGGGPVTFVATGEAGDEEMAARIERHRASRPAGWTTVEEPLELRRAVAGADPDATVVVDCLSLWVANVIGRGDVDADIEAQAMVSIAMQVVSSGAITAAYMNAAHSRNPATRKLLRTSVGVEPFAIQRSESQPPSTAVTAIAQNGRAAAKPITDANTVETSMKAISTRRRPKRIATSLPSTLAGRPSSRIALATVVIVLSVTALACASAVKAMNATSQVRNANSSQQWAA